MNVQKDFYRLLSISQTATTAEIKSAYYRLAKECHPDTGGTEETFKQVSEAYNTLSDPNKRREYDAAIGLRFRRPDPLRQRTKVYAARPPPHWKFTWDHVKHQEMHYGDGMMKEALKQAKKEAEKEGAFEYHSPLGKGFTFDGTSSEKNHNPYSKRSQQGPPKVVFEYEEGIKMGKEQIWKRERIVQDLHSTRRERHDRQPPYRNNSSSPERESVYAAYGMEAASKKKPGDCVIS